MHRTIIGGLCVAIVAATGFAAATGYVLFEDMIDKGAAITNKHVMTLAILGGAAYFGDRVWALYRQGCYLTAFFCLALAIVGSSFCVFLSSGRISAVTITNNVEIRRSNEDVARLQKNFDAAKAKMEQSQVQLRSALEASEDAQKLVLACAKSPRLEGCRGAGRRLADARKAESDADTRAKRAEAAYYEALGWVRTTPSVQVENADLKGLSGLLAKLNIGSEEAIEALLALLVPFGKALFCEVAFLVSIANVRSYLDRLTVSRQAIKHDAAETERKPSGHGPGQGGKPRKQLPRETEKPSARIVRFPAAAVPKQKLEALAFIKTQLAAGRSFPSQDDIAKRVGVTKGTISKWLGEWESDCQLPQRLKQGRCKMLASTASAATALRT